MNNIEEQIKSGEHNTDDTGNSEAPNVVPSAKKVYSKPMLVVLSQKHATGAKPFPQVSERTIFGNATLTNGS